MSSYTNRISAIETALERCIPHLTLGMMNGTLPLTKFDKALDALETAQAKFVELCMPPPDDLKRPNPAEQLLSLADALIKVTRERGSQMYRPDALHAHVISHVSDFQRYWAQVSSQKIVGLINSQPELHELLDREHVGAWRVECDKRVRLVDFNWLASHAAIRSFVAGDKPPGHRCRFCRIEEIPTSVQLVAVDPAHRGTLTTQNGRQVLNTKTAYVHTKCLPIWERWVAIAESYATEKAAADADAEAGRNQVAVPALACMDDSEPAPDESPPLHYKPEQQRVYP